MTEKPSRRITTHDLAQELIPLIGRGLTDQEIGGVLYLSKEGVKGRVSDLYRRLGARNRPNALAIALRAGLVDVWQLGDEPTVEPMAHVLRRDNTKEKVSA